MGLFNKLFGKQENKEESLKVGTQNITPQGITDVEFKMPDSTEQMRKINLRKETLNKVCLTKEPLNNLTARVVVALDYSGSMRSLYKNGAVQDVLNRLLPLGLKFDDNGEVELHLFSNKSWQIPSLNINNFYNYINKNKILKKYEMGGTNYAPVMESIIKEHSSHKDKVPTFVIFITDGDAWDKPKSEKVIKDASKLGIFWQFVGIGYEDFDFLEKLDDMTGRVVDNADFLNVNKIANLSDEELYAKLLGEFPNWIQAAKNKNII
jgi:hypothetical protein